MGGNDQNRDNTHTYLSLYLDFSNKGEVAVWLIPYLKEILENISKVKESFSLCPAVGYTFDVNKKMQKNRPAPNIV